MPTRLLDKSEEMDLARAWLEGGDSRARDKLVHAYQPMIKNIARKHLRAGLDVADLVQEGVIGFLAGLDNFDPDRGYSIGTLARFHIAAHIQLHVSEFTGIIRLPNSRRIKGLLSQCVGRIRLIENTEGRTLDREEKAAICAESGFGLDELEQYEMVMRPAKSIAPQSTGDEEESAFELVDEAGTPEQDVAAAQGMARVQDLLTQIMSEMPERTRTILRMRHLGEEFVSLDSIAAEVGISRERVRRIEKDALAEIHRALAQAGITALDDIA